MTGLFNLGRLVAAQCLLLGQLLQPPPCSEILHQTCETSPSFLSPCCAPVYWAYFKALLGISDTGLKLAIPTLPVMILQRTFLD